MSTFFLHQDNNSECAPKKVRIETYGCQMNVADSEVVAAMMRTAGYEPTDSDSEAAAVLLNTCSIRDNAEQKIYSRLNYWNALRRKSGRGIIIGVIGCMAERLKNELVEKHGVDLVAGPDAYMHIPELIASTAKRRTNSEVKSEQQESLMIPFIKERSEVSMDERAPIHCSLWSCHMESQ